MSRYLLSNIPALFVVSTHLMQTWPSGFRFTCQDLILISMVMLKKIKIIEINIFIIKGIGVV